MADSEQYLSPAWLSEDVPAYLDTKIAASFTTNAGPTRFVTARCDCAQPFKGADRRGAKAVGRAIDDLAQHCADHHEHYGCPDVEPIMWGRSSIGKNDVRWWWRGFLAGSLAPNDVEKPRYSNSGGAQGRLKKAWRDGFEAASDAR